MDRSKCTLTDAELVTKAREWITSLCETGGRSWSLRVPVDLDRDPDMIFEELCIRLLGCPCHEPQPDPTPDTCRWWRDEYGNWCCACSDTMPDFTPWPATDPNGWHCPKCGKLIEHDPTPTGGKTGHDKP